MISPVRERRRANAIFSFFFSLLTKKTKRFLLIIIIIIFNLEFHFPLPPKQKKNSVLVFCGGTNKPDSLSLSDSLSHPTNMGTFLCSLLAVVALFEHTVAGSHQGHAHHGHFQRRSNLEKGSSSCNRTTTYTTFYGEPTCMSNIAVWEGSQWSKKTRG